MEMLHISILNRKHIKTLHYWPFERGIHDGGSPSQRATNTESVSTPQHHYENQYACSLYPAGNIWLLQYLIYYLLINADYS